MRAIGELHQLAITGRARDRVVGEVLDLGGDSHRESTGVEAGDRRYAAASRQQRGPGRRDIVSRRSDESEPGDRDAALGNAHDEPPAATSRRAVATVFPSARAASFI